MRHYSQSLRDEIFKYRKRKKRSLDGSAAGLPRHYYRAGLHHALAPGSRNYGTGGSSQQSIYDSRAFYEWPDQGYKQSASWFEQKFPGTPPLRVQGTPWVQRPKVPKYSDGLLTPELMDRLMSDFRQHAAEQSLLPSEPLGNLAEVFRATEAARAADAEGVDTAGLHDTGNGLETNNLPHFSDIADALIQLKEVLPPDHPDIVNLRKAAHEWLQSPELWPNLEDFGGDPGPSKLGDGNPYERPFTEEEARVFAPEDSNHMDQAMIEQAIEQTMKSELAYGPTSEQPDAFASMEAAYDQQFAGGLEGIVQEAMPEEDPFERQRRMYDEEMMMLMNPFMMPGGFGPGGFGPMGPAPGM